METKEWGEKFLIEEYKALWDYYKRTLDERHKLLEYYYKTVPLPAALIAALTTLRIGTGNTFITLERALPTAAAALAVIFLVGIVAYTTYAKETANSRRYLKALKKIRDKFRDKYPDVKEHLIIDDLTLSGRRYGDIPTWRGLIFVVLNSAIGMAATGVTFQNMGYRILISIFVLLICVQTFVGWLIMNTSKSN